MNAKKDAEPGTRVINKGTTKYFSCKDCREDPKALCNCLLDALAYTKKLQGPVRVQLPDGRIMSSNVRGETHGFSKFSDPSRLEELRSVDEDEDA